MHYKNALQQYFDGELDEVGEDILFGELAHNHDARREFNEHTKLRAAMQKERSALTPPAQAAGAIFGALGYDLPLPVHAPNAPLSGAVAASSGVFLKLLPYALTSLLSALVAVGIFAGFTNNYFENKVSAPFRNSVQSDYKASDVKTIIEKTDNDSLSIFIKNLSEKNTKDEFSKSKNNSIITNGISNDVPSYSLKAQKMLQERTEDSMLKKQIAVIAQSDFKNLNISDPKSLKSHPANTYSKENMFQIPDLKQTFEVEMQRDFSIEMRSIIATSFPENSVAAQTELLKNQAVAGFYKLSDNHSIGLESGQEQFAQEYIKNINGHNWTVRQNPLYWYGGITYRFSLPETEIFGFKNVIVPFTQIFAGAAQTGYLGKSLLGFKIVPESRVAFLIAAEGSMLLYNVDGLWDNSRKLGFSYGVNVSF
ncbi:MAG TPA: hypothetical protein VEC36_01375 [Patescibacteria group bacterium]|nr:hypothetical protein [Patescibacteria group bacterium]